MENTGNAVVFISIIPLGAKATLTVGQSHSRPGRSQDHRNYTQRGCDEHLSHLKTLIEIVVAGDRPCGLGISVRAMLWSHPAERWTVRRGVSYAQGSLMTNDSTQIEQRSPNVRNTVFAGSVVAAASGLIYSTFPVFLGTLSHQFHLGPRELGWLGSDYLGGGALGGLTSILWIHRVRWRPITAACLITVAAGILAAYSIAPSIAAFAVTFMVGVGAGAAYSIAIRRSRQRRCLNEGLHFC